jgi:hypothetical protein
MTVKTANNIRLTNGPAIATPKASKGVFDSFSKFAKPPKRNSVIDLTSIPWARATRL